MNNTFKIKQYGKLKYVRTYAPLIRQGIKRAGHETLNFVDEALTAIDRERGLVQ